MFGNREEKQLATMAQQIEPFRHMEAGFEVDMALQSLDSELALHDRQLLTSNDRYQTGAVFLSLARNRFIMMEAVFRAMNMPAPEEIRTPTFTIERVSGFLLRGYQEAQNGLEASDAVMSIAGFVLDKTYQDYIGTLNGTLEWLPDSEISGRFVYGANDGMNQIYTTVLDQLQRTLASPFLSNNFKLALKARAEKKLVQVENQQKAIKRLTGGVIITQKSALIAQEVYDDIKVAVGVLDEVGVLLNMPRLYDQSFALRDPYDENKQPERRFNPSTIAHGIVAKAAEVRKVPTGKPFNPAALTTPTPPPRRPFNPGSLAPQPGEKHQETGPARHFDPNALKDTPKPASPQQPKRPFNPNVLSTQQRSFDPSVLDNDKK